MALVGNETLLVQGFSADGSPSSSSQLTTTVAIAALSGGGTVSSVSVVSANGLGATITNPTVAPSITLLTTVTGILKGSASTGAITAATVDVDYLSPASAITVSQLAGGSGASSSTYWRGDGSGTGGGVGDFVKFTDIASGTYLVEGHQLAGATPFSSF
jgi:hypothetical protein